MKLNSVLTLLFIALFTACKGGAYDLSGYGLKPDTGENASPLIAKALQEIAAEVNSDTVRILLPKGRYDFYPEGSFMCSRNLGLLLSILCVHSKESCRAINVISLVISFFRCFSSR